MAIRQIRFDGDDILRKKCKEVKEMTDRTRTLIDDMPVLSPTCLIAFKAKAWLDLKKRKNNGEHVDSKNIKKHKNDIFRLAQLISPDTKQLLNAEVENDMKTFFI